MKRKYEIEAHVDEINTNFSIGAPLDPKEPDGSWTWADEDDEEAVAVVAKAYGLKPEFLQQLLSTLTDMAEEVQDETRKDLKDIWERIDELENRIK